MVARVRHIAGALVASVALLTAAACTHDPPTPSAPPTVQPSPPETSLERQQREDFAAAEKSYRTFIAEKNRLGHAGGATSATPMMKAAAVGPYLDFYATLLGQEKASGKRYTSGTKIGYIRHGDYTAQQLTLEVCEDASSNRVLDKSGKQVSNGEIVRRSLYARPIGGTWKMWNGDERGVVQSCDASTG